MEKKEIIKGCYHVADCEHNGDMEWGRNFISRNVPEVKILESYWDGHDCGEAYIMFSFPAKHFVKVFKAICCIGVSFDADINDYYPFSGKNRFEGKAISRKKMNNILSQMEKDVSEGWEKRLPVRLSFVKNDNINREVIFSKVFEILNDYEIMGYCISMNDNREEYHDLLLSCSLDKIDGIKFKAFGDTLYMRDRGSWLYKNNIYGFLVCEHNLKKTRSYEEFKTLADRIINKRPLPYDCCYSSTPIIVPYSEYAEGGILHEWFKRGNLYTYTLPSRINMVLEKYSHLLT